MDTPYAGICGITKEELMTQMSDDIDRLSEKLSLSHDETLERLKQHYDGYHLHGHHQIFSIHSVY